jgi:hypothetical protein
MIQKAMVAPDSKIADSGCRYLSSHVCGKILTLRVWQDGCSLQCCHNIFIIDDEIAMIFTPLA